MPRIRHGKPGGTPSDPSHYRPPTIAELKQARRKTLSYMGIRGGVSQADAAMIMGHPRRWWEGMELTKEPRHISFSEWALFSIFALGESPARFAGGLPAGCRYKTKFSRIAFIHTVRRLHPSRADCSEDPARFCSPSRQQIARLRTGVLLSDGKELTMAQAATIVGRTVRWWQKLEQIVRGKDGFPPMRFADHALFRILAHGDDPAIYANGLARMLASRTTGYETNKYGHIPLPDPKKRKKKK